jgi:hypothetical protein
MAAKTQMTSRPKTTTAPERQPAEPTTAGRLGLRGLRIGGSLRLDELKPRR